jgi:acyl-ACP thioesterase
MSDDAQLVRTIDTHYNDVDINGHINSVKYIEHVLDLWPLDWYRDHHIRRFEIAYVAEAHAGDQLSFYMEQEPPVPTPNSVEGQTSAHEAQTSYNVRIIRSDGTECCRSKVTF